MKTTNEAEAYAELSRRVEGAVGYSFSEAREYLESDDAAELIEAAGLADLTAAQIIERITGYRI